jgi:hypothetical protein
MAAIHTVILGLATWIATQLLLGPKAGNLRPLTRETMIQALTRLGELADRDRQTLTLVVVGGAALVLRYNARAATQDVDVYMETPPERQITRTWAAAVAREYGLPTDWLNDGAKGYMQGVSYGPLLLESVGIRVYQVSAEQLLAMKLSAWRNEQDQQDAMVILRDLAPHYASKEDLWNNVVVYVNHFKAQYTFEELWNDLYE